MRFLKNLLIPHAGNVYRPHIFETKWLALFLGLTLAAESFLAFNVFGRGSIADFIAAVIGSELVQLTNVERIEAEAPQLAENELLRIAAQAKADDMAARGYFSHTGPDGKPPWAWVAEAGYDYRYAGENLAVRFVDSSDVVEAWMASPSHRENIVKPVYEDIGIGVAEGVYKDSPATFVVQFFGTPRTASVVSAAGAPAPDVSEPRAASRAIGQGVEVAGEATEASDAQLTDAPPFGDTLGAQAARAFAEPRFATTMALVLVAAVLLMLTALTFFLHLQVQPVDLLLKGLFVALLPLALAACNYLLTVPAPVQDARTAAVGSTLQTNSIDIAEAGVFTERFMVSY